MSVQIAAPQSILCEQLQRIVIILPKSPWHNFHHGRIFNIGSTSFCSEVSCFIINPLLLRIRYGPHASFECELQKYLCSWITIWFVRWTLHHHCLDLFTIYNVINQLSFHQIGFSTLLKVIFVQTGCINSA